MQAIDLLIADHNRVRGLFAQFKAAHESDDTATMSEVARKIFEDLEVHTTVEEEIFYPAFKRKAEEAEQREMFFEAKEEHALVDVMLPKVKSAKPDSELFAARAKVLKDLILHHKKEEEREMFKAAKQLFSKDELQSLGAQMQRRKRELKR